MNKLIKFNLYSLEVSIKVSQLLLVQTMYNANLNNTVGNLENEIVISDKVIRPEDLNTQSLTTFKECQVQTCTEVSVPYNSCFANSSLFNPYSSVQDNPWPYCNPFFSPSYPSVQESVWPYYSCNYSLYPNFYCGSPVYYYGNSNPLNSSARYFHTQQSNQRNSRHFYKRFGFMCILENLDVKDFLSRRMDIMSLRIWEKLLEKASSKPGFIFTLMSYNVLAQDLIEQHPYLYSTHERQSLSWSTRWNNILKEISHIKPDIICLQEVQETHINDYYSALESLGFRGIFKKRTGSQSDGCAIYYKTDKIEMVEHNLVEFFQPAVSVLNRDNVGIVAKFVPKLHPTREFVVATTHLLYNPRRDDVRLAQMQLLLTDIEKMSYKEDGEKSYYLPIVVTGDFNSPPNSDVYEFVAKGKIKYENLSPGLLQTHTSSNKQILVTSSIGITDNSQYLDVVRTRRSKSVLINLNNKQVDVNKRKSSTGNKDLENQCEDKIQQCEDFREKKTLSHKFSLKSVYDHGSVHNTEGTTHQNEWLTVDYIFYSVNIDKHKMKKEDKLKLLSRYRLPTSEELGENRIPNRSLGSDHLSLIAKFQLEF